MKRSRRPNRSDWKTHQQPGVSLLQEPGDRFYIEKVLLDELPEEGGIIKFLIGYAYWSITAK